MASYGVFFPSCPQIAEAGTKCDTSDLDAPDARTAASRSVHHSDFLPMKGILCVLEYLFVFFDEMISLSWLTELIYGR